MTWLTEQLSGATDVAQDAGWVDPPGAAGSAAESTGPHTDPSTEPLREN